MAGAGTDVRVGLDEDGMVLVAPDPHPGTDTDAGAGFGSGFGSGGGRPDERVAAPEFAQAVLDVAGAVLVRPVLGAPGPPVAEIHDPVRAQQWLWALYGERVAAAVHAVRAGSAPYGPAGGHGGSPGAGARGAVAGNGIHDADAPGKRAPGVRVPAESSALAGAAARLGLAHWAARWWPASYGDGVAVLEPGLLALESAALTHRCQQLFDDGGDQPDDCAAELIGAHPGALGPLLQWWRAEPRTTDTARHLDGVLRLIVDAADCAGLDGTELRELRSALERGHDQGRTGAPADLGALFARRSGYALAAGAPALSGGRVIARGYGTNDWCRYPPGLVDASEEAVSWTARAVGARRLVEIEAVAHVAAPVTGVPLVAEIAVNGGGPLRVPLARRDDLWTGRAEVDLGAGPSGAGPAPPHVRVGVLLPGFDPGAGPAASAGRAAVRALARRRLAAAALPVEDGVRGGAAGAVRSGALDGVAAPFLAEILAATAGGEDH
ncbi:MULTISPECIES: hypothetical protein [unclassified Streptomyces]|uniref:hypothetical protein n=1 Tax=unclassified Streptomyces TaxID=2593676 RepID=UPI0038258C0C